MVSFVIAVLMSYVLEKNVKFHMFIDNKNDWHHQKKHKKTAYKTLEQFSIFQIVWSNFHTWNKNTRKLFKK